MSDIVEQLRQASLNQGDYRWEAAEEIGRLRQVLENARQARVLQKKALVNAANEIYRLRAALERFACTCDRAGNAECSSGEVDCPFWQARAALEGKS